MTEELSRRRFSLQVTPLSRGKAVLAFTLFYVASVVGWRMLPLSAASDLKNYWPVFLVPGVPLGIAAVRLLWNALSKFWFAAALAVATAAVAGVAALRLPADAAYGLVYRSMAFVTLICALAVSLIANILAAAWDRRNAGRLVIQAGLLVVLAGGLMNIYGRVRGTVTVARDRSESAMTLNDYVLTFVSNEGAWTRLALPVKDLQNGFSGKTLGTGKLSVEVEYAARAAGANSVPIAVKASDGAETTTITLYYNGGFAPLEVGKDMHRVSFGSTRMELPFVITLNYAGDESINAPKRPFDAAATLTDRSSGQSTCVKLLIGTPVSAFGYSIRLLSVNRPWSAAFAVDSQPGNGVLSAGAVVMFLGLALAVWLRWTGTRKRP